MHYFRERCGRGRLPPVITFRRTALACVLLAAAPCVTAQGLAPPPNPFIEELRQQERERALRERQERDVDARLPRAAQTQDTRLPEAEFPCFHIDRLLLVGELADGFQWALGAAVGPQNNDSPIGQCLGSQGVNIVLARLQQAVIAKGYVTTRVLAAPQDLSSGTLSLTLVPGRIAAIRLAQGSSPHATLANAIPALPGDLLNLRDIEQGLENLKRVPTAEADIQISPATAPGARPGDSDLVVQYRQAKRWRGTLSLDDSGTEATGRYQSGATLSLDNPFGLNDLFYVSANHSIDKHLFSNSARGTEGQSVHYSLPWGYWLLSATASSSRYHQSVAGATQTYDYAGKTDNAELKLTRMLYRDQSRKTSTAVRAWRRSSHNFIDDTEVGPQRRIVGGWEASLAHKEFIGPATLEGNLAYRRGTGAFGAIAAPEQAFGEGESHFRLLSADLALNMPFKLGEHKLRYSGLWRAQWNRSPLTPQDRFAIGGRYSVRGFDGETSLLAERGWLVRNDIGWSGGDSGAELYAGVDYGHVGGPSARQLQGDHLAGAVTGVRGVWKSLNYDVFVGAPISRPTGYRSARITGGFNLNHSF